MSSSLVSMVPANRLTVVNSHPVNSSGAFVTYWMIANRRTTYNFSLQRAIDWAEQLHLPLVIFEALRAGYPWASDRIHQFVIEGMAANRTALKNKPVIYYPYLEPHAGAGKGALAWLAKRSAVVVSDDFPCFFLPQMLEAAQGQIPVRFELIDSNGMWPMRNTDRVFMRAYDFRRFLQKNLLPHLSEVPTPDPFAGRNLTNLNSLPIEFCQNWPSVPDLNNVDLKTFPIDHAVRPVPELPGGAQAANEKLDVFLNQRLKVYSEQRNQPEVAAASELSPYLHFGHLSVHEIFDRVCEQANWNPKMIAPKPTGSARGWWGVEETVESFLDELITWRELGYNRCALTTDFDQFSSLPDWAQLTLKEHANDPRDHLYSLEQFELSQTHDPLWNAAQTQLVREGRIHNYLRMLWGKKILEWSPTPQSALQTMIQLNNKYALDGRNPNSYSGIFWVLGRYDRAWGPERPVFGKIRFMSSDNTARKVKVKGYIARYSQQSKLF